MEYDALGYNREHATGRGLTNILKRKQKTKGLEVTFNPADHRDFLTGFRKRKQQRRLAYEQKVKRKQREERVQSRAEKRQKLKQELGLPDNYGVNSSSSSSSSDEEQDNDGAGVKVYKAAGMTTTVTTVDLNRDTDSDQSADDSHDEGITEHGGSLPKHTSERRRRNTTYDKAGQRQQGVRGKALRSNKNAKGMKLKKSFKKVKRPA